MEFEIERRTIDDARARDFNDTFLDTFAEMMGGGDALVYIDEGMITLYSDFEDDAIVVDSSQGTP